MSKSMKSRLEKIEAKNFVSSEDAAEQARLQKNHKLLEHYDFLRRQMEQTLTREELWEQDKETTAQCVEWYVELQKLSPEERARASEKMDREIDEENKRFDEWKAQHPEEYNRVMHRKRDIQTGD